MSFSRNVELAGWGRPRELIEPKWLDAITDEAAIQVAERRGGIRDPLAVSIGIRRLAEHPTVRRAAEEILGPGCFIAQALFFDKTERSNWKVPWHQDLTITVRRRVDVPGFGPWSTKDEIAHVQPPVAVLERMLAVRVHLDDCRADNGPVRVLPGTHRRGKLTTEAIESAKRDVAAIECLAVRGEILVFRPLLLHASSPATKPSRRRVIHFEFAVGELPGGLEWQRRD